MCNFPMKIQLEEDWMVLSLSINVEYDASRRVLSKVIESLLMKTRNYSSETIRDQSKNLYIRIDMRKDTLYRKY